MNKLSRNKQSFQRALDQHQIKKDLEIKRVIEQIGSVTAQLKGYRVSLIKEESDLERKRLNHKIILLNQRRKGLKERLKQLGYEDKRGRPKKIEADTYKGQRIKFTAHLLPKNMEYLKQLKESKKIDNISAFLDELIQSNRKKGSY
ncbi:hypothetical protein [Bacillus sp. B1-b2]|uniref:hypothetical protein n=1 Tax=Bacillus sp. B1-b2 TaxID=2653201 RepID=UPI001261FDC0|nr:hypothetical protein [Bacillus sp. B1-b2]KAB7666036.1 hypothetical protein F9279_18640 [Bacillus sp. B1-b2]